MITATEATATCLVTGQAHQWTGQHIPYCGTCGTRRCDHQGCLKPGMYNRYRWTFCAWHMPPGPLL